jgi:WD40 repeat protein
VGTFYWLTVGLLLLGVGGLPLLLVLFRWKSYWSRPSQVRYAWFRPSGETVTIDSKNIAQVIDSETGMRIGEPRKFRWVRRRSRLAISPDSLHIACRDHRGRIEVREWLTGKKIRQFANPNGSDWCAFSVDGKFLVCSGIGKAVHIWNWRTEQPRPALQDARWNQIHDATLSPDFRYLVAGFGRKQVRVWDLRTQQLIRVLRERDQVLFIVYSPTGRYFAVSTWRKILIREAVSGKLLRTLKASNHWPAEMKFSPNGRYLATANDEYPPLSLWDVETGTRIWASREHEGFCDLEFSPDGKQLKAIGNPYGGPRRAVLRWRLDDGCVCTLPSL